MVNAGIDISKIILASEKRDVPKTYEQALLSFGILAGLDEEAALRFASFGRLRNIPAHEYLDLTFDQIKSFIKDAPPLFSVVLSFLHTKI